MENATLRRNHRAFRNFGRSMLTPEERRLGTPWYAGAAYSKRRDAIARRVARKQAIAHERALMRREARAKAE